MAGPFRCWQASSEIGAVQVHLFWVYTKKQRRMARMREREAYGLWAAHGIIEGGLSANNQLIVCKHSSHKLHGEGWCLGIGPVCIIKFHWESVRQRLSSLPRSSDNITQTRKWDSPQQRRLSAVSFCYSFKIIIFWGVPQRTATDPEGFRFLYSSIGFLNVCSSTRKKQQHSGDGGSGWW